MTLPLALLAAAVLAAYATSLPNGFTYDDTIIWDNEGFETLVHNPSALFTHEYFTLSKEMSYRPVATATYLLDFALWGESPLPFHLVNVLWHLAAVLALYLLLVTVLGDRRAGFLGALLFAIHPVNTEAVNNIGFRDEMLCGAFYFAALALFIDSAKHVGPGRTGRLVLGAVATAIALFSKEMALSLPLVLGLRVVLRRLGRSREAGDRGSGPGDGLSRVGGPGDLLALAVAIGVTLLFAVVRFHLLTASDPTAAVFPGGNRLAGMATMAGLFLDYMRLLVVPWPLWAERSVRIHGGFAELRPLLGLTVLAGLAFVTVALRGRKPGVAFCLAAGLIALGPVSNVIPFHIIFAERYLYIPWGLLCGAAGTVLAWTTRRKWDAPAVGAILLLLASVTAYQNTRWRDDFTLWSHAVKHDPFSQIALFNLGNEMTERKELDAAVDLYRLSLDAPLNRFFEGAGRRYGSVYYNLGRVQQMQSRDKAALGSYHRALLLTPGDPKYLLNLAVAFDELGDRTNARKAFAKLQEEATGDLLAMTLKNLGIFHARWGEIEEARKALRASLAIKSDDEETRRMLDELDTDGGLPEATGSDPGETP